MAGTETQWMRALWQSYGIADWISTEVAQQALCDNIESSLSFQDFDIKKDRLAPVVADEVVKAGAAGDLDTEMLPHELRRTLKRESYDTPARKVRQRILDRRSEWFGGHVASRIDAEAGLDSIIGQLIERLRVRLLVRPLPDDELG